MIKFLSIYIQNYIKSGLLFGLMVLSVSAFAQTGGKIVSGKVTDSTDGSLLPGVSVLVKGTTTGTVSNASGEYSLKVSQDDAVLVFSFVGMKSAEMAVSGRNVIDIALDADLETLKEVVVVGYGTQDKKDVIGSISSVAADDFKDVPVASFQEGLQGRAAGVVVTESSGEPGGGMSVLIRGGNSVLGGNQPLYVIDGFPLYANDSEFQGSSRQGGSASQATPTNQLAFINPADIESVEILKDNSATAIYGARGANGVVLITTKKGKAGEGKLEFSSYVGVQKLANQLDLIDGPQWGQFFNQWATNNGEANLLSDSEIASLPTYDYQKEIMRESAMIQNYNMSVSGGSDATKYMFSFNYMDQEGQIESTGFNRFTFRTNVSSKVNDWLELGLTSMVSRMNNQRGRTEGGMEKNLSLLQRVANYAPVIPFYGQNSDYWMVKGPRADLSFLPASIQSTQYFDGEFYDYDTPLQMVHERSEHRTLDRVLNNAFVNVSLLPGLSLRSTFGLDMVNMLNETFSTSQNSTGVNGAGVITANKTFWVNENYLTYDKSLGNHKFNVVAGFSVQEDIYKRRNISRSDFLSDGLGVNNLGAGAMEPVVGSSKRRNALASYYGRLNYSFNDKYLLTFSARNDASSKFAEGNKSETFLAFGAGWRIIEENFMSSQTLFSDLKLRASYGTTGNQEIGSSEALAEFAAIPYSYNKTIVSGVQPISIANPELEWERTSSYDIGLDMSFIQNRIRVTTDYYYKETPNLLLNFPIPSEFGYAPKTMNKGVLENKGIELSIAADALVGSGLNWTSSFNFSKNINEVKDIAGLDFIEGGTLSGPQKYAISYVMVGQPVGVFLGYRTDGLLKTQTEIDNHTTTLEDGTKVVLQPGANPGAVKVLDLNGDGILDGEDREVIGNPNPEFTLGWNNNFSYKGFDLTLFLQGAFNYEVYNMLDQYSVQRRITDVWDENNNPDGIYAPAGASNNTVPSSGIFDYELQDASFIRLRNATLGYNFQNVPGVRNLRLYVTGKNLFTITDYRGYNPDVNSFASTTFGRGIEAGAYPTSKVYTIGVNVTF
ncbi:MAG: TonB-dependent receptor [Reichenbachiella sp.]|uniref:SusC/RagA family TonB-linked outer membrane protein n=1 Tax=Reichenbachiella sp. TaxID=2184521 RepID=UPI003297E894